MSTPGWSRPSSTRSATPSGASGLFVSIDRTRGLDLDAIISTCKAAVETPA